jgi:hypothetical protein
MWKKLIDPVRRSGLIGKPLPVYYRATDTVDSKLLLKGKDHDT